MADHVAGPKHTADYFDPVNEPEPSAETGLGTHFNNTFDPALKKEAPALPMSAVTAATGEAASAKLASTSSAMTTKELQQAAVEGDPNGLTNGLVPPDMGTKKAPTLET